MFEALMESLNHGNLRKRNMSGRLVFGVMILKPFSTPSRLLKTQRKKAFENIVRDGESLVI